MSKVFTDSFREFVSSLNIPFLEDGLIFSFPLNGFTVVLSPHNAQLQNEGEGLDCTNILFETPNNIMPQREATYRQQDILYLFEDRWFYSRAIMEQRILARLERFRSIFARKCKILYSNNNALDLKIREFIERYHPYGYARSKFRLALEYEGEIVAAAAFSASRPMPRSFMELTMEFKALACGKNGLEESSFKTTASDRLTTESERLINKSGILTTESERLINKSGILTNESERLIDKSGILATDGKIADKYLFDSYEWVRYISLPGVRVVGGMGKLLNAFVNSVAVSGTTRPIEIMSYSDNEWSAGDAYRRLGFTEVALREPVTYYVDKKSFERLSFRKLLIKISKRENSPVDENLQIKDEKYLQEIIDNEYHVIKNMGSRKFLLQKRLFPIVK